MSTTIFPPAEADPESRRPTSLDVSAHQPAPDEPWHVTSFSDDGASDQRTTTHRSPDARAAIVAHLDHLESGR